MSRGNQVSAETVLYGTFKRTAKKLHEQAEKVDLSLQAFLDDIYHVYSEKVGLPYVGAHNWIVRNKQLPQEWAACQRMTYVQASNTLCAYCNFLKLEQGFSPWLIDIPGASSNVSFNEPKNNIDLNTANASLVFADEDVNISQRIFALTQEKLSVKLREKLVVEQLTSTPGKWKYFGPPLTDRVEPIIVYLSDDPHISTQLVLGVVRCARESG